MVPKQRSDLTILKEVCKSLVEHEYHQDLADLAPLCFSLITKLNNYFEGCAPDQLLSTEAEIQEISRRIREQRL